MRRAGFGGLGETIMVLEGLGDELSMGQPRRVNGLGAYAAMDAVALHRAIVAFARNPKVNATVPIGLENQTLVNDNTLFAISSTFAQAQRLVTTIPRVVKEAVALVLALTAWAPRSTKDIAIVAVGNAAIHLTNVYRAADAAATALVKTPGGGSGLPGLPPTVGGIKTTYLLIGAGALVVVLLVLK